MFRVIELGNVPQLIFACKSITKAARKKSLFRKKNIDRTAFFFILKDIKINPNKKTTMKIQKQDIVLRNGTLYYVIDIIDQNLFCCVKNYNRNITFPISEVEKVFNF